MTKLVRALNYLVFVADSTVIYKWWKHFPDIFDFIEVCKYIIFVFLHLIVDRFFFLEHENRIEFTRYFG